MSRFVLAFFFMFLLISSPFIPAQDSKSIQLNAGVISPLSSSKGLIGLLQYNHQLTENIYLYIYSGYSAWDKDKITYQVDWKPEHRVSFFNTYSSDKHSLIPLYLGSKINFNTTKYFTTFVAFEAGYTYLNYNSYNILSDVDHETGKIINYYPDPSSQKEVSENLVGLGLGAGLSHPMSDNINIILSFKLNTYLNSNYYGFFSNRGTYTAFIFGFDFNL
jgi:hypothetical protein